MWDLPDAGMSLGYKAHQSTESGAQVTSVRVPQEFCSQGTADQFDFWPKKSRDSLNRKGQPSHTLIGTDLLPILVAWKGNGDNDVTKSAVKIHTF